MRVWALGLLVALMGLVAQEAVAKSEIGNPRLMQGPMVAYAGPDTLRVWVRANGEFEVWAEFSEDEQFTAPIATPKQTAQRTDDFCLTLTATGLKPGTRYYYRVYVHKGLAHGTGGMPAFHTQTAPAPGAKTRFKVAFGSCARYTEDRDQPIWDALHLVDPQLFFWLGDNVYGDTLEPSIIAEEYRRQRDVQRWLPFMRRVPQMGIWDDHDYMLNDHDRTNPVKEQALTVWKQYWPAPQYGQAGNPGVYFQYQYGGVDFFFLDGRYYRDGNEVPDSPEKTFLGKEQVAWLKAGLKASTGAFKVIACGSGFNLGKGIGGDSWAACIHERNEIFNFIRDEKIGGVLLISGDTHVGELNCIPWSEEGGYDLYELVSSPLAQTTSSGFGLTPERRIRETYLETSNSGILDFDLTGEVPVVRMNLVNQYQNYTWDWLEIRADELVNGVKTWDKKQSPAAKRMDTFSRKGRGKEDK